MGTIVKMSFEDKNLQEMGKWTEDIYMILKKKDLRGWSAPTPVQYTCILWKYSMIFSETSWPIKAKFYRKHPSIQRGNQCLIGFGWQQFQRRSMKISIDYNSF